MSAGKLDLIIEQGSTFSQVFTILDSTRAAFDLTGYTARMQIRETLSSTTALLELTTENGRIALGGTAGTVTLTVAATDTEALTFLLGVYDLEIITGTTVTRLLAGNVKNVYEVTR